MFGHAHFAHRSIASTPVGDANQVADELQKISKAGFAGTTITSVNYVDELPFFCAGVLPPGTQGPPQKK
jgi:hypothetical protein